MRRSIQHLACAMVVLIAAATADATPWPLGTYTSTSVQPPSVPQGFTVSSFSVTAPGVTLPGRGFLAVGAYRSPQPQGVAVFFTGGGGTSWWTDRVPEAPAMANVLRDRGFTVVQVRWQDRWLDSSPGNDAGTAHLGARPATVINRIHQQYYVPMGVTPPAPGQGGFVVTGNSGGASQTGFALSHYGLDSIIDVAIPTGGPPHAALAKSMMNNPQEQAYWYDLQTRQGIDQAFGYFDGNGPGAQQNPAFIPRWLTESHSTGGNDYHHPNTRVHFIQGEHDPKMITIAGDYHSRLQSEGTPMLGWDVIPGTPHLVIATAAGREALMSSITQGTRVPLGDANYDGAVNLADFNILAASFGQSQRGWRQGDFTGDRIVNLADFNALAANFGLSASGQDVTPNDWSALAAAIPEPGFAALACLSTLLLPRRRR